MKILNRQLISALNAVLASSLMFTAIGCGPSVTGPVPSSAGGSAVEASRVDRAEYYAKFIFKVSGDCSNIDTVSFHGLYSFDNIDLGQDSKGRPEYADVHLQLFQDHTYWLQYTETAIKGENSWGGSVGETLFDTKKEGTWSVSGDQIVMSDLATGIPLQVTEDGKPSDAIEFSFSKALNDPRLLGKSFSAEKSVGNTGPRGISINQYCHVAP